MARTLSIVAVTLILAMSAESLARPAGETPPRAFTLTIAGEQHTIHLNAAKRLKVGKQELEVRLTASATRLFDNAGGLRFRYPADFTFTYDDSMPIQPSWSLDGSDCIVMVFDVSQDPREVGAIQADIKNNMVQAYRASGTVETTVGTMNLGGKLYATQRLNVVLAGSGLIQDLAALSGGAKKYILLVQDSVDADPKGTAEGLEMRELLKQTLSLPK